MSNSHKSRRNITQRRADGTIGNTRRPTRTDNPEGSADAADPIDVGVGVMLRKVRLGRKMTQAELGAHIGVSLQQIQKYEKGVNRISASTLYRVARVMGVGVGDFFALAPDGDKTAMKNSRIVLIGEKSMAVSSDVSDQEAAEAMLDFTAIQDREARNAVRRLLRRLRVLSEAPR